MEIARIVARCLWEEQRLLQTATTAAQVPEPPFLSGRWVSNRGGNREGCLTIQSDFSTPPPNKKKKYIYIYIFFFLIYFLHL